MFNHIMVGSNDLDRSRRFYDAVLGTLGFAGEPIRNVADSGHARLFYRHNGGTFCISEPIDGEPASAASVAGAMKLVREGVIAADERVVCILTGHQLKDPTATVAYHGADQENFEKVLGSRGVRRAGYANRPVIVPNDLDDIIRTIALYSDSESESAGA